MFLFLESSPSHAVEKPDDEIADSIDIDDGGHSAFLTESSFHGESEHHDKPPYIVNVHVSDDVILQVKKM